MLNLINIAAKTITINPTMFVGSVVGGTDPNLDWTAFEAAFNTWWLVGWLAALLFAFGLWLVSLIVSAKHKASLKPEQREQANKYRKGSMIFFIIVLAFPLIGMSLYPLLASIVGGIAPGIRMPHIFNYGG